MEESTTREKVLKKIRAALLRQTDNPYPRLDFESPVFQLSEEDPVVVFAEQFEKAGGNFILIDNELEFAETLVDLGSRYGWKEIFCPEEGLSNLLTEIELPHYVDDGNAFQSDVSLNTCECLISRTGSLVVSSIAQGRKARALSPVNLFLGRSSQIFPDIPEALNYLRGRYPKLPAALHIITGPTRTADVEGELVIGAQGPRQVYLFLIDDRFQTEA